jgi:hypothetical protein
LSATSNSPKRNLRQKIPSSFTTYARSRTAGAGCN